MTKLSTGDDATLGAYKKLATAVFGSESKAVKFLDDKIAEAPNGESEEVVQAESQVLHGLMSLNYR